MPLHPARHFAVLLTLGASLVAQTPAAKTVPPGKPATAVTKAANATSSTPLDINTATPDQLMQLPGIGQAYSKRIIDGRPYTAKNQLLSRGILPQATYEGIAGQIIAHRPAK